MRKDHRPYLAKRLHRHIERSYVNHFIKPNLDSMGAEAAIMKPWNLKIHGPNIHFGRGVHVITARDRKVQLTVWCQGEQEGRIDIGNYALLCPGVRLDSACHIEICANTMIAAGAYLTDADWHDIYDRTKPIGNAHKITLHDNVWIGDSAIICKGVSIGANSIIGAGSVVTRDIPANVIAAGNPATVVKELDTARKLRRRRDLLADAQSLNRQIDYLERSLHGDNSWLGWLRTIVRPKRSD